MKMLFVQRFERYMEKWKRELFTVKYARTEKYRKYKEGRTDMISVQCSGEIENEEQSGTS